MSQSKIYLLEDEFITQELVKQTLQKFNFKLVGVTDNAEEAYREIQKLNPDLVLLDINVSGDKTGLWLADLLIDTPFIFLTAYSDIETLQTALKTKPASYLVKPYNEVQLIASIELCLTNGTYKTAANNKEIVVKDGYEYIKINLNDILYIESDNNYIVIHTINGKRHVIRETLSAFLEKSAFNKMIRTHRSFAVNLNHVTKISSEFALLRSVKVPITRSFKDTVKLEFLRNEKNV